MEGSETICMKEAPHLRISTCCEYSSLQHGELKVLPKSVLCKRGIIPLRHKIIKI